ncbi:bifunctional UDP-N-acetylglucosamine diphosphorylase/glucosamine-1-phosphate N-acetyltransferase GlmU [Arthrobacter sp. UM1]|uniref:bifunctional UDP-N-acetylglucosamine diphosphorylase/glucosamine-1-phosphate N-acetyltransferase GlmU n=1 Tax=Arthrobacter sp. UM1 TaxID=2766776 RepID=UPI001CF683BD|nr:bifunctional UDP-N-acetylglucosamine diphosphorylase/glucosamine-1-phosphate N-acetyltransferase GlmU [Arthrobacter sp. UM1]MCB4207987.1 bifunctional UDP-N-acetylglucosamine diphosphorylase/glucosamine-1-phosphate N-acetyltransferase GlmU [Arthrobacter sp. UM1]
MPRSEESPVSDSPRPSVIVLAAGAGTRMKSEKPKIMHEIGGRSMVGHALRAAEGLSPEKIAVVVRHQRDRVVEHISRLAPHAAIADQDEVPGTGRAVQAGLEALEREGVTRGTVLVTSGDVPLMTSESLQRLAEDHESAGNAVTVLTAVVPDATGYGRIVRGEGGEVLAIVEHKDATEEQRAIREFNAGVYAFDIEVLKDALSQVTTDNAQGEMYLTDVLGIARSAGGRVAASVVEDVWQVEGANDRVQLAALGKELNRRTVERAMRGGATVVDPDTTWIDDSVVIGQDVTILPNTQLHGATEIASGASVGPDTTLTDVVVGEGASVVRTHGSESRIGAGASVGPFAYLRPGTSLGEKGKIGTFVETKNAEIGSGSKVPHLSYVGDATIGEGSNIGAASVFVNYDGVKKHRTVIGSHVRMGSDNMYVAPVTVGDGAYSGAGTVVRKDVPAGALAITVAPQRNIERWVTENRPGTAAAEAAEKASE